MTSPDTTASVRWIRPALDNTTSVLLLAEPSSKSRNVCTSLVTTVTPAMESIIVVTSDGSDSILSEEIHEEPPVNLHFLSSSGHHDTITEAVRKAVESSPNTTPIVFFDALINNSEQREKDLDAIESLVTSVIEFIAEQDGFVYVHADPSVLDETEKTMLTAVCEAVTTFDATEEKWRLVHNSY